MNNRENLATYRDHGGTLAIKTLTESVKWEDSWSNRTLREYFVARVWSAYSCSLSRLTFAHEEIWAERFGAFYTLAFVADGIYSRDRSGKQNDN